jgi:N-carbamoylputrescine amidase
MTPLIVAAVQLALADDLDENLDKIETRVREVARRGAQLVVLQELIDGCYFCKDIDTRQRSRARPATGHPAIMHLSRVAKDTGVVLTVSFYEQAANRSYNSLAMIDADGKQLGLYRKSHIPDSPGYSEKTYFADGDTGLMVHDTAVGKVGAGICWDQWFPEAARAMVLMGADLLVYPTAIGSEPSTPGWDSRDHWQRAMQGHAAANLTPVIAANRVGVEKGVKNEVVFYGSSFITDFMGAKIAEADRTSECVISAPLDMEAMRDWRRAWGVFRDRRPDLYGRLLEPTPRQLLPAPDIGMPKKHGGTTSI